MSNTPDYSGVRDFDFLIGKWRVRHRTLSGRLTGATDWHEADAIDIVRPAFAGLGNVGRFMRRLNGQDYEGMPTRLYDPGTAQWRIWWLDTLGHRMEPPLTGGFRDGVGHFEGDDTLRGEPIRVRFSWTRTNTVTPRWEQAFSPDGGATWESNSIMDFTRDDALPDQPEFPLP